jgi:Cu/Ag efflux pump CusA
MGTRSIRRPITLLLGLLLAACALAVVGASVFAQRRGQGPPGDAAAVTVVVVAAYPGASAEEVERQVTLPLEVTFAGIPGLRYTRSQSVFGLARLRLEFANGINYDQARRQVSNRLAGIARPLPKGVTPQLVPYTAGHDILRYTLAGPRAAAGKDVYTADYLRALQDGVLQREFRRVPGIIDVTSYGGTVKRYEIQPDPERMKRYGITLTMLPNALANGNANVGGDYLVQGRTVKTVRSRGPIGGGLDPMVPAFALKDPREAAARLRAAEQRRLQEIRSLVITTVKAIPVRLADVVDGGPAPGVAVGTRGVLVVRRPSQARVGLARRGGPDEDDRVLGVVLLRPGADRQATLDRVKARVQEINGTPGRLLPGVRIEPLWERGGGAGEDLLTLQAGFPAGTSPKEVGEKMRQARALLLRHPEVRAVLSQVGPDETRSGLAGAESGQVLALLRPAKDRPRGRRQLAGDMRAELARKLAGTDWDILPDGVDDFQAAFVATPGAGLLKIVGPDFDELERLAGKAGAKLRRVAGVTHVHVRHVLANVNLQFRVDRKKCAYWGVDPTAVNKVIALVVDRQRATDMVEEKTSDLTLRWPGLRARTGGSILDIPFDVFQNEVTPGGVPAPGGVPGPGGGRTFAGPRPRLRLRDLMSPVGANGEPDPKAPCLRPGAVAIWREQGRRLIAVRFGIRGPDEAAVLAEARARLAHLFRDPSYRAEWSSAGR